ncbi:hypothetical protein AB0L00_10980 [Actinoallomurus sp. NPDC052308]|uniref:hypothetical protein n=1 Tax=Actinoallomurus sp. NPDC052308 TaxID=3155530 RepID=UPI00343404CC
MRRRIMVGAPIGAALVAVAGTAAWWFWPPHVDHSLMAEASPIIDRHLENRSAGLPGEISPPAESSARWFCAERTIETHRRGTEMLVSLITDCREYALHGTELHYDSASQEPLLVTLDRASGRLVVRRVTAALEGAMFDPSLKRMFSRRAYRTYRLDDEPPSPDAEARRAFGLPSDAPVHSV